MKLLGLQYKRGENEINYSNKKKILNSYANLVKQGNQFFWMTLVKDKNNLSQLLGEIIFPLILTVKSQEITDHFKEIAKYFYDYQDETIKDIPVVLITAQDPTGQPLASRVLLATMGEGLSLNKLLRGSLELSALLLKPD